MRSGATVTTLSTCNVASLSPRQPELTYVLRCADLCKEFQEDLEFRFSLGLSSIVVCGMVQNVSSSPKCTVVCSPVLVPLGLIHVLAVLLVPTLNSKLCLLYYQSM